MKPGFYNWEDGIGYKMPIHHYERYCWFWYKAIYEVELIYPNALYFVHPDGSWWRPDNHYFSDMGSVPMLLQAVPGLAKDRHLLPYLNHDAGYTHKGLWKSTDEGEHWHFVPMVRAAVDDMLLVMCSFDIQPGNVVNCYSIWSGVRLGGRWSYGKGDEDKRGIEKGSVV